MIFARRLRAMVRLGQATLRVAERAFTARVEDEEQKRSRRLGDVEGQTARAQAFADRLEGSSLVTVTESDVVVPIGWPI